MSDTTTSSRAGLAYTSIDRAWLASSPFPCLASEEESRLFQALVAESNKSVVLLDIDRSNVAGCRILYANGAFCQLNSASPDANVIGQAPFFWPALIESDGTRIALSAAVSAGEPFRTDLTLPRGAAQISLDMVLTPLTNIRQDNGRRRHNAASEQVRYVGIVEDLTEQRRLEYELRGVMTSARCLMWHGKVEKRGSRYNWTIKITNEEGGQRLWPVAHQPQQTYTDAWLRSRFAEDSEQMDECSFHALENGEPGYTQEYRIRLIDGEIRWLAEDVQIEAVGENRWHLVGVCIDITERKQAEVELRDIMKRARCLIWQATCTYEDNNWTWDLRVSNEQAAMEWLKITPHPDGVFHGSWWAAKCEEDKAICDEHMFAALNEGNSQYTNEFRMRRADGQIRWLTEDVQVEVVGPGRWHLVGVCTDISERKALEAERERMLAEALERADQDPLTGLWNHRAFHDRLNSEADRALRLGTKLGIAVMDLDNFKFFNDAYGHPAGDEVLRVIARTLKNCCRSFDIVARFGGDEFAVLMPDADQAEADRLAQRLAHSLADISYNPPGADSPIPLTLSIGAAVFPDDSPSRLDVLNIADTRLLHAKSGQGTEGERIEILRNELTNSMEGFSMLNALVCAVDNKDRYTRKHSEDVVTYCLQIAQILGLSEREQYEIQVAALLHDVGKIGVSDAILRKPGKLTDEEYEAIKQHPTMGAIIVGAVPGFEFTLDAVRYHHERWDGNGYPSGLLEKETPLMARIMAVGDAYSAMTTDRTYRKGMSPDKALDVLAHGAGTQWDPECIAAFMKARKAECCINTAA